MTEKQNRNGVEVAGFVRGMDVTDFPDNKQCQVFLNVTTNESIVLTTNSLAIQARFETAFAMQRRATVVYDDSSPHHEVLQVRFNYHDA